MYLVVLVELGLFLPTIQTGNSRIPANHILDLSFQSPVKLRGPQMGGQCGISIRREKTTSGLVIVQQACQVSQAC